MNVSCPACKTRYSVDDARVPPTGVTIKCPKCAHTFVAKRPDAAPRAPSAVALPGSVAPGDLPVPVARPSDLPAARAGSAVALPGSVADAPRAAPAGGMGIPSQSTDAGLDDLDLGLDDHDPPGGGMAAPAAPPSPSSAPPPPSPGAVIGDSGVLDFIDDTADRAHVKPGGPSQVEYKVRRRNGRVEGPYGVGRISAMVRNKEMVGTEDISEDGVAWRAMTSDPQLNSVINEIAAAEDQMDFGNVDLGAGAAAAHTGGLEIGLDDLPPSQPPASPHHPSVGPAPGGARSASSIEDIMGDLDGPGGDPAAAQALSAPAGGTGDMGGTGDAGEALKIPGGEELEVGDIPELPPFWQTYKKPILIFSVVMGLILVGVFTHLFTPYGAFGIPGLVELALEEPPPPPPVKPPPPPPKVADPEEVAGLIDEHCYECFRSVFATIASAGPSLPDNMLALAKARGFATLAYGKEAFPTEDLVAAVEALNTVDLAKALGGNAAAANNEILKARSALEILSGAPESAEPQLAALLEQRPDDRELALLLGLARRAMKKPAEALEALDKALVTAPTYTPALHTIGEIVLELDGPDAQKDAAVWFDKALKNTPSHARSGVAAAELYEKLHWAGQRRRVLRATAAKVERGLPPDKRAAFLHTTALAYEDVDRLDEAADIAAEAARLDPANTGYIATAARAAAAKGSTLEALQMLAPVLKRDPNDIDGLLARARVYIDTDDIAKGFLDLEAAKAVAPRDYRIDLWEARFNAKLGKLADARKSLTMAIRRSKTKKAAVPSIELGRIDLAVGDVDAAFENAEEAVRRAPQSASAHTLLGHALVRRGQLAQAKDTYAKALEYDDELMPARLGYANTLRDTGAKARRPESSKELAEAIPIYLAALEADPQNPQVLFEYGRALELQGKLPAALELYRQAAAIDEKDPRPHLKMVAAYLDQEDLDRAKESLERGRTIEMASGTKSGEVRFWEARLALADNRIHDAVASMRGAVELEPRNALYHYWTGRALEKNNSLYEAITYYEKAVDLNSRLALAHRALGWTALERHQFEKARTYYDNYKRSAPDDRSIYVDIGESYTRQNRDEEALKAFKTAIRYLPKNGTALVQMGNIMSRKGKPKEAIEYFDRATKAEPGLGVAWCQYGIATARSKTGAATKAALRKCLDFANSPDDMKATARDILGL